VFWWLILNKSNIINFWDFSVKKHTDLNGVLADYVAEIIDFNWEYSLVRDWLPISNWQELKLIEWGDTIILNEWTDLIFNLSDGTQAKIIWPAEFSITKRKKWFEISLVDWKFFRIYSPESKSEIDIVTPELLIHQDKNQILDVHIAKEDKGEILVKNSWDNIKLAAKNNKEETTLMPTDLVSINQNTDTIDILEDSDVMSSFMSKNNISATFTLSTDKVEWPKIEPKTYIKETIAKQPKNIERENINKDSTIGLSTEEFNKETNQEEKIIEDKKDPLLEWIIEIVSSDLVITWNLDVDISSELWINIDNQQVPSQSQMKVLTTNLNSFFLMNTFESIYNGDKAQQNILNFANRINSISSSFWYTDRANPNLSSIKNTILTLKNKLEDNRYISPSYILQMKKIANWCDELSNPTHTDRESLKSVLPEELRLK